ncbi:MAG: NACHT domain-containing protein [Proteobacteria bacterium]|nr:MAG: NACHT domain-containing protein [Pseudomonadota bacterium]
MQKSIEGMLRAVLHALLSGLSQSGVSENLEVIQHVCESRWQSTDKGRAWSSKELKEMLSRLAQTSNAKVFLLIDALDECDPQDRLGDLADMILWLSRLPNVKLCVSCRPWAPFTRRFDKATVLHLDQLTYHDMEVYIEQRLLCAENEADLCTDFHDGTLPAKRLINDVADAANGVFLWV